MGISLLLAAKLPTPPPMQEDLMRKTNANAYLSRFKTHLAVVIPFQMHRLNAAAPTARSPDSRVVTVWSLISQP